MFLKEQSEKMEKLGTALKRIQKGMLKNNPQPVKMSVGQAAEVLGSLVNTHKHLIESGVEFQKELESLPISRKMVPARLDRRGILVGEMVARNDLIVLNKGKEFTFRRGAGGDVNN